ncbi:hypothetical protein EV653_6540 [Kribbella pratensis]|uniref:Uncharacterized protein n=1 Tax=Kribbella pratensis TaxID=2512112 RepID=A0A4R8BXC7_9ACTN|nr:hypothetical protein EV653_6540 [Kribbella pratensis]
MRERDLGDAGSVNRALKRVADLQGGVVSTAQATAAGYTLEQIRERLADGRWERVRYGQYAERIELSGLTPWERQDIGHRRLVHAAMNSMRPQSAVASHYSALLLHGVPVWGVDLAEVQLTRTTGRTGLKAGVRHHRGLLEQSEIAVVDGRAVTSIARAVVETASRTSFEAAVISADAALRRPDVSRDELRRLIDVTEHWPGGPAIRSALAFADARSESVGETRLRVLMHNEGLPTPELQVSFDDEDGFVARVDFFFADQNTVVEFDGRLKYAGGSPDVLIREKDREDRLRCMGFEFVRTGWADFARPHRTAGRIRDAFARSRSTRLAG